ncbi:putative methionine--tRNA ligase [Bidens hawaiensis]|uniref:putative methionine--tRNA ligase n=1 Tax=Bidens hawaiensis TaxID=980011 RepID=UPI00404A2662
MASANGGVPLERKRAIVSALCKSRSLDATKFLDDAGNDIKSLSVNIMKTAYENNEEFNKRVAFAEKFPSDSEACLKSLSQLNEYLTDYSVLVGGGSRPSDADIIVFSTVHQYVANLPNTDRNKLPNLLRWVDYIQSTHDFGELFERIVLEKAPFDPPLAKQTAKVNAESSTKKGESSTKKAAPNGKAANSGADSEKKTDSKQASGKPEAATEKKKSVSLLKIQVGLIRKASKHPSADSLLVEEIDVGEGKCRQVVSGLAKFCSTEELTNRLVALITNVKPGKLRDVVSGLVLCASNADHTVVEPLIVPEGAKFGEIITFAGHEGKPEDVLNPKKKQLDKITPNLFTDDKGVATFKGVPFMTSAGPCTSTIPNAGIK